MWFFYSFVTIKNELFTWNNSLYSHLKCFTVLFRPKSMQYWVQLTFTKRKKWTSKVLLTRYFNVFFYSMIKHIYLMIVSSEYFIFKKKEHSCYFLSSCFSLKVIYRKNIYSVLVPFTSGKFETITTSFSHISFRTF